MAFHLGLSMVPALRQQIECSLCKRALGSREQLTPGCQPKVLLGEENRGQAEAIAKVAELRMLGACPACHQVGLTDWQIEAIEQRLRKGAGIKTIEPCPKCGRQVVRVGSGFAHHNCPHGCRCEIAHVACAACRQAR